MYSLVFFSTEPKCMRTTKGVVSYKQNMEEHGTTILIQPPCLQQTFSKIILERDGEMEEMEVSLLLSSPP